MSVREGEDAAHAAFRGMWSQIRDHPLYRQVPAVLFTESVAGYEGTTFAGLVRGDQLVLPYCAVGPGGRRAGVPKGRHGAEEMTVLFKQHLVMGTMQYTDRFVTYGRTEDEVQQLLARQLRNWQWQRSPRRPDAPPTLSGKVGADQDDLLITLLMVPYWASAFHQSTRSADVDFRRRHRI